MIAAGSGKLVGRAEELARLLTALERAEQGQPAMVLLSGDAGIGKTRLLAELADRARRRGAQVLVGGCLAVGDVGLPYVPVVAALRSFVAQADNEELVAGAAKGLPALGRLLPELAGQPPTTASLGEGLEQLQLFDAVASLLLRLSNHALVLLVVEDLHWADPSTRDLLAFLHQTLQTDRVLVVASYRSDELHRRHPVWPWLAEMARRPGVERLDLGPLSRAELAEHLAALCGARLSTDALTQIFDRSEGNPFYAEELLAAGADQAQVALPKSLAELLLARVQVLSDAAQQVLRVAAVAGRQVSHQVLVAAAGRPEPEVEAGLGEAIGTHLLLADAAGERYTFRHALLQEAIYGDLLPSQQVRLHANYARLLAEAAPIGNHHGAHPRAGGPAAELAYHCLASHDLPGALAASVQAAAEVEGLAPAEALRHLDRALALWERVPKAAELVGSDRIDLMLRAAEMARASGAPDRAVAFARQAVEDVDPKVDPLGAARAYERLAHHLLSDHDEEKLRLCLRAAELVPEDPPTPLRARVSAALAQSLINVGQRDEARRWCMRALTVAQAVASTGEEADVLITLARVEASDNPGKTRDLLHAARKRAADAGRVDIELRALINLGWLEHDLGELEAACVAWDEGAERAEQASLTWSPYGLAMRGGRCYLRYVAGDWDASDQLAAAVDDHMAALAPELSADTLGVQVGRGRTTVNKRLAHLTSLSGGSHRALDVWVDIYETEQANWQGDLTRASAAIKRGLEAVGGAVRWAQEEIMLCAAGLAVQTARAERAQASGDTAALADASAIGRAFLDQASLAADRAGRSVYPRSVHVPAWLAKAKAEWTRLEGRSDPKAWQAAVEAFSFGAVYEVARCQWRLAEALLGVGDREQATAAAQAAHQTAVRLGAEPLQAALEVVARRGGLHLGVGVPAERGLAGLTPRELEVLRLLTAGHSNRQIAEELFISGKTASVHVTHILTKLGVHSRLEAAARARELGLDRPADHRRR